MNGTKLPRPSSSPTLGAMMMRILRTTVELDLEYDRKVAASKSPRYITPPTTDMIAKHFGLTQRKALEYLNYLQLLGFIVKRRRYSAGLTGYGYDGSLYSEVYATESGRAKVAKAFAPPKT